MYQDEVIAELWRIRDAYAAEKKHSLKEIVDDLQRSQQQSRRVIVDRRPAGRADAKADTVRRS